MIIKATWLSVGWTSLVIMSPENGDTTYLVTERGAGYQLHSLKDDELWLVGPRGSVSYLTWLVDARIRREASVSCKAA